MTDTTHLGLPFIEDSQAQKHVTHNEALRILDAVIQIVVEDVARTTPPSSPAEGQRHVIASGASGTWIGHAGAIATWQDGAWVYLAPKTGWCLWSIADASIFIFDGSGWQALAPLANDVGQLGINTTASTPNLLSVKSNAALLAAITTADGGSGDARLQISKETPVDTASVFFSDNYSGRAEFGLTGDNHFRLKVSPDGASWQDAFVIDEATANVSFNGFTDAAATRRQLSGAPIDALGALNMFPNGGFEGGAEASATAITLTATSILQSATVVDGVAVAYRGSFVAAVQQVASPFAGGRYAAKFTVSSAQASLGANDELCCVLTVPGLQSAKLALGTASAQPQSLGFWFQAHRTGSYSGSIRNGTKARSHPFSFTVTAADAPQWISLTGIAGDASGTWAIDTGAGLLIAICLAAGTSRTGLAAAWAGADYSGATGTTNGVAATSDVFYIGNIISVPGNELPDAARAAFAMGPRNDIVRTDTQSLTGAQKAQARSNLGAAGLADANVFTDMTASTTTTTGAATFAGGIGVAGTGNFGGLNSRVTGNVIGASTATGYNGALAASDASILTYAVSSSNWAGIGTDNNGHLWFRSGTSGAARAQMAILTSGEINIRSALQFPTGTSLPFIVNNGTNFVLATNAGATAGQYMALGGSTWTSLSDARIKSNVRTIPSVLGRLEGFRAVAYRNDLTGNDEVGVIAQELYGCFPEFVTPGNDDPDFVPASLLDEGAWNVSFDRQGAYALHAVKELLELVRKLEADIADLRGRLPASP
jgi:hypothetical protein